MKMIEVINQKVKINNVKYNFIVEVQDFKNFGVTWGKGKAKPKFYTIKENNEIILSTTSHQKYNAYKKRIMKGV